MLLFLFSSPQILLWLYGAGSRADYILSVCLRADILCVFVCVIFFCVLAYFSEMVVATTWSCMAYHPKSKQKQNCLHLIKQES